LVDRRKFRDRRQTRKCLLAEFSTGPAGAIASSRDSFVHVGLFLVLAVEFGDGGVHGITPKVFIIVTSLGS